MTTTPRNPYFDDYNEDKNFYRILFRPGRPVQARELTQLQTMIQGQIERFGRHVFREGSIVLGGQFNIETRVDTLKLGGLGLPSDILPTLVGRSITGQTSGIVAYVYAVASRTEWDIDEDILLVRYLNATEDNETFVASETLDVSGSALLPVVADTNHTGLGSLFSIEEGVVFSRGFFVKFQKQRIVLDPTSTTPSCKIGFNSEVEIVTSNEDDSLLDNSQGSFNFAAPGADRLRVVPGLVRIGVDEEANAPDFLSLFTIKNGQPVEVKERTDYARIYDELAKRTYDESGDYVVRGMNTIVREHLDTGANSGYLTSENGGDPDLLAVGVEPGLAYVKGYEVNNLVTKYLETPKSTDFKNVNSEVISARNGNYILVEELVGWVEQDKATLVTFYNTAENRVSEKINRNTAPSGASIGTAKVKSVVRDDGNIYRVYLFDIQMDTGYAVADIRGVSASGFFADTVLENGVTVLQETSVNSALLFPVGTSYIRSVRGESDTSDTIFTFRRTIGNASASTGGVFSVSVSPTLETHAYGTSGTLSNDEKDSIIVTINNDASISLPGTVDGTSGSNTITGTSTFFTRLNVGEKLTITGTTGYYTIQSIASDTSLTLVENLDSTVSGASYQKEYLNGDVIDLNGVGSDSGATRTVTVTTDKTLSVDLKETFSSGPSVAVSFNVTRNTAQEIAKTRRSNRLVKIDCSTLASLTDPINLGFSDVFQIRQIRKSGSAFTDVSEGTVVTSQFVFDNGQRDSFYGHATITPTIGAITATDYLLVELDYFFPDFSLGVGYFSVDSYDINDAEETSTTIFTHQIPVYKSRTNGEVYDLRNYLDFRPVLQNTATDATTVAGASTNPSTTNSFYSETNGLRIPVPSSRIFTDYSYYLARRDVVVVDREGRFSVVQGVSATSPVSPTISEKVMGVANVFVPPYPSLATTYARILNKEKDGVVTEKITNVRHTMRDIGLLEQRIDNLEYYTALTLLEKSAADFKVVDENGLDRFKNGFFVDGFLDHSLGATYNDDYKIAVDSSEQVIRPRFSMESFKYSIGTLSNTQATGALVTLPYTEEVLLEQERVTTTRNIEQSVYRFIGNVYMTPDTDVWVDTNTVDKTVEIGNDLPTNQILSSEWNSWEKHVTGYRLWDRRFGDRNFNGNETYVGSYNTYAEALAASRSDRDGRFFIETISQERRTGVQTGVKLEKNVEELGNFVTDVSVIPYIRPQVIRVFVRGLKARTKYYVFFDGEDMSQYCTPGDLNGSNVIAGDPIPAEGSELRSDDFGELGFFLRLPAEGKRFRIGSKEVTVTDNPTNSVDATSYAKGFFVANGVSVQRQNTILSTKIPIVYQEEVTEAGRIRQEAKVYGPSCMAYSFKVEAPSEEPGVFLSSVDVFVESVHPTLGVWFEIREMNSAGGITRTQVPFSEVWYTSDEVTTTDDGTVAHKVVFPSPVFLLNDTQYAFVIHTEGLNPDTYFWISRLGETDIITNTPVNGRQLTGNVYTTNNNLNWDIVPDVDLKVRFNRANFSTGNGSVVLRTEPRDWLYLDEPSTNYTGFGEEIVGSQILTLGSITGGSIVVGDQIRLGSRVANVLEIVGTQYYTDYLDISDWFEVGDSVDVHDSGGIDKGVDAIITSVMNGQGILESYESNSDLMVVRETNGYFFVGGSIKGTTSEIETTINSFGQYKYSVMNFKPNELLVGEVNTSYQFRSVSVATGNLTSNFDLIPDSSFNMPEELTLRSRSDEVKNYAGQRSGQLTATLTSNSGWVSPVIDTSRANSVLVFNIINDDDTNEELPSGGNLENKYISKVVTLADGQDAEDLLVAVRAYIPQGSDVDVWMKIRHREDGEIFADKGWIKLEKNNVGVVSSSVDANDFIDLEYRVSADDLTGPNEEVQYESNSNTFTGFKQFSVKVGLKGTNSALVPRVGDLRVIALQK